VCQRLEASQRRACQVLGQRRGTQRYRPRRADQDKTLVRDMKRLSRLHPRYGYRRIAALLRAEGWSVNRKRVHRLWRQEGLKGPGKKGKRKRLGDSENGCLRRKAEHINHVWSYDFVSDQTADGRRLKLLVVLDEYTRESLAIEVERRIKAEDVLTTLGYLSVVRGAPQYLRSDNGRGSWPQRSRSGSRSPASARCISPRAVRGRMHTSNRSTAACGPSCSTRRCLETCGRPGASGGLSSAYNHYRPHSSLNYATPAAFAAACLASAPASAGPSPTPNRKEVANSLT
jgi:putative transposase